MKIGALLAVILCTTFLFGEDCKVNCSPSSAGKVVKLTDCERKELQAAEYEVERIKDKILLAHGKPSDPSLTIDGECRVISYKTYEVLEDTYVVELEKEYYPCITLTNGGIRR